jgi:hypothetical protein
VEDGGCRQSVAGARLLMMKIRQNVHQNVIFEVTAVQKDPEDVFAGIGI